MVRKIFFGFLISLVSPIISLLISFRSSDPKVKRWLFITFITFYGSVIQLAPGTDGYVHQNDVYVNYLNMNFGQFLKYCGDIIFLKSSIKEDLYIHFVSFFVGSVLGMPKLFFVIISFVFAYFYTGSLFKVIKLTPKFKYSYLFYGFLTVFVLWKSIEGINTVRTWTGLWVLFYAFISYAETRKLKYLLLLFVPLYIHVGYYVMAIPSILVAIFGSFPKLYSVLFFISFGLNLVNPEGVTEKFEATEVGQEKVQGYYVEEQVSSQEKFEENYSRGATWYKALGKGGIQVWSLKILALIVIVRGYYNKRMTKVETALFSAGILTMVLSSSTWFIYALESRSAIIGGAYILAAFIMMAQRAAFNNESGNMDRWERYLFILVFISLIPFLILKISEIGGFLSFFTVSLPFLVWFSSDINMSLKDGFKDIIGL